MIPEQTQLHIPMGGYAIFTDSNRGKYTDIFTLGAQTCIVLVLKSTKGIALAHIDTPNAIEDIKDMIAALNHGDLTATLVGGDFDYFQSSFSSFSIYNPIIKLLQARLIPYSYSHHSYLNYGILLKTSAALYSALRLLNFVGPESALFSAIIVIFMVILSNAITKCASRSFDVGVNLETGKISIIPGKVYSDKSLSDILQKQDQLYFAVDRSKQIPQEIKGIEDFSPRNRRPQFGHYIGETWAVKTPDGPTKEAEIKEMSGKKSATP